MTETLSSTFDYFDGVPIQTSIVERKYIHYAPLSAIQKGGPITFVVPGTDHQYLDLFNSLISVRCKIVTAGDAVLNNQPVGPVNYTFHSLCSDIHAEICGKQVSETSGMYCYKALLEALLTNSKATKEGQLTRALWYKDTAGSMEICAADGANTGFNSRAAYFVTSREVELRGRPHLDIFHQRRAIPSNCSMKLRLLPKSDEFILMSDGTAFKLIIMDARLSIHTLIVSPALELAHAKMVLSVNFRFPIRLTTTKYLSIQPNQTSILLNNVYLGPLPDRLCIAMVDDRAMTGDFTLNPYNFHHFGLTYLCLTVNGQMKPSEAYTPNFPEHQYLRSYESLFEGTGTLNSNTSIDISRGDYSRGYTIWVIDLSPDNSEGECTSPKKTGSIHLEKKLGAVTARTINVIFLAEFDSLFEIDQYRNLIGPAL